MSQILYGKAQVCDGICPFSYDVENEKITVFAGTSPIEITEGTDTIIGQPFEMFAGGCSLFKLSVPLSNCSTVIENKTVKQIANIDLIRPVEYIIKNYHENSKYTEMRLQFPELDYFIPSVSRTNVSENEITFSRVKDVVDKFEIQYCDTTVSISFCRKIQANTNVKAVAKTISEVVVKFPETDNLNYLINLYNDLRCFFSFVCNRLNIGLRSATLIGTYPTKTLKENKVVDKIVYTKQDLIINQKFLEPLEDKKSISKTLNYGFFKNNIKELFQLFFEKTSEDTAIVNVGSLHHSLKYRNLIDLEQSLHITATFEYYMRTLLPEISSQETIDFYDDIKSIVLKYAETVGGKKKKKANDLLKSLCPRIPLSEKIKKAYEGYSDWNPLKSILSERFGDDISNLASAANLWRNELAHEKRTFTPDENVVYAIRLLEHINYCIVLRKAGYNDNEIKLITDELLTK